MPEYPQHPISHTLEKKSDRYLKNCLPINWIVDKPSDYGIDYRVEIVQDESVLGYNFSVQLKSHKTAKKNRDVVISLRRSTVNLFINRLEPILLICYIEDENEAFFTWFQDSTVDLTKSHDEYSIKLNRSSKLSDVNWNDIFSHVKSIFSRKFLLNTIPQIDFSEVSTEDEKLALAHFIKGEFDQAEQIYKKLLLQKTNFNWLSSLALCQYSLYRYDEALITVNKALEIASPLELLANKACILAESGIRTRDKAKVLEAKSIFEKVIKQFPESNYCYNYANTLTELGEYGLAESYYKKALKKNPNSAQAWKNLGQVYFKLHNHKKEILCYNNALLLNPRLPEALMSKGIYLVTIEMNVKEGLDFMIKAVNEDSKLFYHFQMAYFWFAHSYFALGLDADGLNYLAQGLNHHPGDPYLLNLKKTYYEKNWQNDPKIKLEAIEFLKFTVALNAENYGALSLLIEIYLSDNSLAKDAYALLRKHTAFLPSNDTFNDLGGRIQVAFYLKSLPSYYEYALFRSEFPVDRYIIDEIALVEKPFLDLIELLGLGMFTHALKICRTGKKAGIKKSLVTELLSYSVSHYPSCAPILVSATKDQAELIAEEVSLALILIPQIALRECGTILAYLGSKFCQNSEKIDKSMSDQKLNKVNTDLTMATFFCINDYHKIFPE